MHITPYLHFEGRCDEAIEFYGKAVGAEVKMLMRFKDAPDQSMISHGNKEKVMHAELRIGDSTVLVSDGRCQTPPKFQGFSLATTVKSEAEADKCYNALADGGQPLMPLAKTFFSPRFGMVTDRFGVMWMVMVGQ
ncbi:MAG TPA: VOC family protein [Pirellulales bacterium]|nr:VOC family protein [Pirellulales bacterium]